MDIVNICPTCKVSITRSPLVDILVTYQEDLTESEIYEQGWHKKCYPPAPALLTFGTEALAWLLEEYNDGTPGDTRPRPGECEDLDKLVEQGRAAIAEARPDEKYLASYDYSGDMRAEDVQGF